MDEQKPQQIFWFRIASAIGSLLAAAFLAWAGVVWSGWQDVSDKIFGMAENVAEMRVEVRHVMEQFRRHEGLPWHDEAGHRIIELQSRRKNGDE